MGHERTRTEKRRRGLLGGFVGACGGVGEGIGILTIIAASTLGPLYGSKYVYDRFFNSSVAGVKMAQVEKPENCKDEGCGQDYKRWLAMEGGKKTVKELVPTCTIGSFSKKGVLTSKQIPCEEYLQINHKEARICGGYDVPRSEWKKASPDILNKKCTPLAPGKKEEKTNA